MGRDLFKVTFIKVCTIKEKRKTWPMYSPHKIRRKSTELKVIKSITLSTTFLIGHELMRQSLSFQRLSAVVLSYVNQRKRG